MATWFTVLVNAIIALMDSCPETPWLRLLVSSRTFQSEKTQSLVSLQKYRKLNLLFILKFSCDTNDVKQCILYGYSLAFAHLVRPEQCRQYCISFSVNTCAPISLKLFAERIRPS